MSTPSSPPKHTFHQLWQTTRWALNLTWTHCTMLLVGVIGTSLIISLTPAILAVVARGLLNTIANILSQKQTHISPTFIWLGLGFGATAADTISKAANHFFRLRLIDELNIKISIEIMTRAANLNVNFFENPANQDTLARAQANVAQRLTLFVIKFMEVITTGIQIISLFSILAFIEPLATFAVLPLTLPYLLFQWRLARLRYEKDYTQATKRRWTRYYITALTNQNWISEVKLLNLGPLLTKKFERLMVGFRNQDQQIYLLNFIGQSLFFISVTLIFYAVFVRVISTLLTGLLTIGDIAIYSGTTLRLSNSFQSMMTAIRDMREGILYVSDLYTFLKIDSAHSSLPTLLPVMVPKKKGHITFENVSFHYQNTKILALKNISFEIKSGETVAIVGENGAGKTTLAKLIARLYNPTTGVILFDDIDIKNFSLANWHKQISFVFQPFNRYEASLRDNIIYGNWENLSVDSAKIEKIAQLANIERMVDKMPAGYNTRLGLMFSDYTLSSGQWQKIAIARAFARTNSTLLILDEPSANLDARSEHELLRHFRELAAGRTTLLISHRFSTVSIADRILVLHEGRLVEQGTHQALLAQGGYYASLYNLHKQ